MKKHTYSLFRPKNFISSYKKHRHTIFKKETHTHIVPEKIQPAIDRYQNESRRLFEGRGAARGAGSRGSGFEGPEACSCRPARRGSTTCVGPEAHTSDAVPGGLQRNGRGRAAIAREEAGVGPAAAVLAAEVADSASPAVPVISVSC